MKSSKHEETKAILDANTIRPSLPNLVIHRILTLLPAKAAVRMSFLSKQWEGVWSLSPVLDFEESGKIHDDEFDFQKLVQHKDFINLLQRYLEYREKDKQTQILNSFRLRMTRYLFRDYSIVNKWFSFACERSVKEVDLSLPLTKLHWHSPSEFSYCYCLSRMKLLNAQSITTLNLEYVHISLEHAEPTHTRLLPSLKNMSLRSVIFNPYSFSYLIWECPSIECMSLATCLFEESRLHISSSSLKSLEVTQCDVDAITVDEAVNLEYFTLSSQFWHRSLTLNDSFNLKYISIHADLLTKLNLHGFHASGNATIHTPRLRDFNFHGFINSEVSLKAPCLSTTVIVLGDMFCGESHFLAVRDFLKAFDGSGDITLNVHDFKVLICPQNFRETFSSPLQRIRQLKIVLLSNPPTKAKDVSDLNDSLAWMAPSASRTWEHYL